MNFLVRLPLLAACGAWLLATAAPVTRAAETTDGETDARIVALDVAGAFSNDGYKIRDGIWTGEMTSKDKARLVMVSLYAGNQYFFSLGVNQEATKMDLAVYDETGKKVSGEIFQDGAKTAVGFNPSISGSYFVSVRLAEGGPASFCLLYSYK